MGHKLKLDYYSVQFSQLCLTFFQPLGLHHARPPCPSPTPRVYSNSCPLSWWCHPTISSSVIPFSSCLQWFPASGSFQMFFTSGGQSIKSFSFNISPSNENSGLISFRMDWLNLLAVQGILKSLLQKTTVQKHQFFCAQLSLSSNSHNQTWLLEKSQFSLYGLCQQSNVSAF